MDSDVCLSYNATDARYPGRGGKDSRGTRATCGSVPGIELDE